MNKIKVKNHYHKKSHPNSFKFKPRSLKNFNPILHEDIDH